VTAGEPVMSCGVGISKSSVPSPTLLRVTLCCAEAPDRRVSLRDSGVAAMSGTPRVVPVATLEMGDAFQNSSTAFTAT
jgi:hypothetical protein